MQKKKKNPNPKNFFLPGQAPGEVACLSLPGQVFSASCPQARGHCFLRRQGLASPSRPRVTTRLVATLAQEAGGSSQESVRWPEPGPPNPSPASCGLRVPHGRLRKLAGANWAKPGRLPPPASRSGSLPASSVCRQLLGSLSQPLQAVNAESIETAMQTVPTLPLGREGRAGLCQGH